MHRRPVQGRDHVGPSAPGAAVSLTGLHSGRSARAAESARLEIVCWATNRGFKSHLLRSFRVTAGQAAGRTPVRSGPVRSGHEILTALTYQPPAAWDT